MKVFRCVVNWIVMGTMPVWGMVAAPFVSIFILWEFVNDYKSKFRSGQWVDGSEWFWE